MATSKRTLHGIVDFGYYNGATKVSLGSTFGGIQVEHSATDQEIVSDQDALPIAVLNERAAITLTGTLMNFDAATLALFLGLPSSAVASGVLSVASSEMYTSDPVDLYVETVGTGTGPDLHRYNSMVLRVAGAIEHQRANTLKVPFRATAVAPASSSTKSYVLTPAAS